MALQSTKQEKKQLYVHDDYGTTGLLFYLTAYKIPYKLLTDSRRLVEGDVILTNNKRLIEDKLSTQNIAYRKLLSNAKQYNFYIITTLGLTK